MPEFVVKRCPECDYVALSRRAWTGHVNNHEVTADV
jgi:uncharacterized C2H2 Zn-finger protein